MNANTWKIILATLVIFGTGVVTGGLLVKHATGEQHPSGVWFRPMGNRPPRPGLPPHENPTHSPQAGPSSDPDRAGNLPLGLPQMLRREILQRMEREMTLTAGQREKIEVIIREAQERTRQVLEPIQSTLRKEMQTSRERIREVLTEEQKQRFDELMKSQPPRRMDEPPLRERRMRGQPPRFGPEEGPPRQQETRPPEHPPQPPDP